MLPKFPLNVTNPLESILRSLAVALALSTRLVNVTLPPVALVFTYKPFTKETFLPRMKFPVLTVISTGLLDAKVPVVVPTLIVEFGPDLTVKVS